MRRNTRIREAETVCLDDTQMKNIIEAARADEAADTLRMKKACPKALKFVKEYAPREKRTEDDIVLDKIGKSILRRAKRRIDDFVKDWW